MCVFATCFPEPSFSGGRPTADCLLVMGPPATFLLKGCMYVYNYLEKPSAKKTQIFLLLLINVIKNNIKSSRFQTRTRRTIIII